MAEVYIGLGSNLSDRQGNLKRALELLTRACGADIIAASSILETEPVDFTEQPMFLNQVLLIRTDMGPEELLGSLQAIEDKMGRIRTVDKGTRVIDLDILLYNSMVMESEDLTIPHPEIRNRNFVLDHLIEINPDLRDPVTGEKYREVRYNE